MPESILAGYITMFMVGYSYGRLVEPVRDLFAALLDWCAGIDRERTSYGR